CSQILHHLIGHVAGSVTKGAAGGMRSNHGGFADFERIVESLVADVGNVHNDAEAVHFAHDVFAKIREAVVNALVGGGIRPLVVAAVRQGHVAHAEAGKFAQRVEVGVDHVPAFDAHQSGDLALFVSGADFGGGGGQGEFFRVSAHLLANCLNLRDCAVHGFGSRDFAGNPDRKENRVQAAFAHAWKINAAVVVSFSNVKLSIEEALGCVVVGIHNDRGEMQFLRARGNIAGFHARHQQATRCDTERSPEQYSRHFNSHFSIKQ